MNLVVFRNILSLIRLFNLSHLFILHVCLCTYVYVHGCGYIFMSAHMLNHEVEVKGQLAGVSVSLYFYYVSPGEWTGVTRLDIWQEIPLLDGPSKQLTLLSFVNFSHWFLEFNELPATLKEIIFPLGGKSSTTVGGHVELLAQRLAHVPEASSTELCSFPWILGLSFPFLLPFALFFSILFF